MKTQWDQFRMRNILQDSYSELLKTSKQIKKQNKKKEINLKCHE